MTKEQKKEIKEKKENKKHAKLEYDSSIIVNDFVQLQSFCKLSKWVLSFELSTTVFVVGPRITKIFNLLRVA